MFCTAYPVIPRALRRSFSALRAALPLALLLTMLCCATASATTSVLATPHNLSASGHEVSNYYYFAQENRVCIFCHTPHSAFSETSFGGLPAPLWNHTLSTASYATYVSTTLTRLKVVPGAPTGSSRLCLSCHDGTVALNSFVYTGTIYKVNSNSQSSIADSNITADVKLTPNYVSGTSTVDISADHPISFAYTDALASLTSSDLAMPESLPSAVRLDQSSAVQCTSCHDPHDNEYGNFLVMNNAPAGVSGSPLCSSCHAFSTTGNSYDGSWAASGHMVNSNSIGCTTCHQTHSAPQASQLLSNAQVNGTQSSCLTSTCHTSTASSTRDIKTPLSQTYAHAALDCNTLHADGETIPPSSVHVVCLDCHNPHRAAPESATLATAPAVNGPSYGVKIDNQGDTAANEYQICYKCHSGGTASNFWAANATPPNRRIQDADESNRFSSLNPSFHPVVGHHGTTYGGASLITAMRHIYCTDCHGSDQSTRANPALTGANGPHGSQYEHILIAQYDMPPKTAYPNTGVTVGTSYALCFRCHQQSFVMGTGSGFANGGTNLHTTHVVTYGVHCSICHDPHGVSQIAGGTTTNNSHLINFNKDYAGASALYQTTPNSGTGSCTVSCHSASNSTPQISSLAMRQMLLKNNAPGVKHSYSR